MMQSIKNSVGNNMKNDPDDVRLVSSLMQQIGNVDGYENQSGNSGYITRELDNAIKIFQQDNNLKIDGILHPRGETETFLQRVLKGYDNRLDIIPQGKSKFPFGNTIGFGGNITGILDQSNPPATEQSEYRNHLSEKTVNAPHPEPKPKEAAKEYTEKLEQIDKDLDTANKRVDDFKKRGYTLSAELLEHFLKNEGKDFELSKESIQKSKRMQEAIDKNKQRFEDSIVKGHVDNDKDIKSPFNEAILSLKDGETIELINPNSKTEGDQWDKVIDPRVLPVQISFLDKDPDQMYSTGTVQISSSGKLTATREGDTIIIKGDINHDVNDVYDFNSEGLIEKELFKPYQRLAENKKASYFNIKGTIPQQIEGRIKIENGKITESQFDWQDRQ